MTDLSIATQIVHGAVDDINEQLPPVERLEKKPDTVLSSETGGLDSLTLINLVVEVESRTEQELGRTVTLVTEDAFSLSPSPFSTIGSLAGYLHDLVNESSK